MEDEKKLQEEINVLGWREEAQETQAVEFNNEVCDQGLWDACWFNNKEICKRDQFHKLSW